MDFEAKNFELRNALKTYQDSLSREHLEKENTKRAYLHEKFERGKAHEKIKDLKAGNLGEAYQELKDEGKYWKDGCKRAEAYMAERDVIINNLQALYSEWKEKFMIMASFSNYVIQELLERLKEADQIMCLENTHFQVFNFVILVKRL